MPKLEQLRESLDKLDDEIAKLLHSRAELVLEVRKAKEKDNVDVYSPTRERQILNRVLSLSPEGKFPKDALERIFLAIISSSRSLIGDITISHLGSEFSLGREAVIKQFGENIKFASASSVSEVFLKVEKGETDFGVVPAVTSSGNFVVKTFDHLLQTNLRLIAEVDVPENFCLVGKTPGLSAVRQVYADAYSFDRCVNWLKSSLAGVELKLVENSELAIKVARENANAAAIALEAAADKNQLYLLAKGIANEDLADAKFYALGKVITAPSAQDKTVLACTVKEKAGALREILLPFAEKNISLLKIESRPVRSHGLEYVFFIEALGHQDEANFHEVLAKLEKMCSFIKVFGSFAIKI